MPVLATSFDTYLSLYDDFSRYPDTVTMDGQLPIAGAVWKTTGETLPKILAGYLVSDEVGYLYSIQSAPVSELGCDIVWSGAGDTTQQPMTLTISPDATTLTLTKMLHFNFGPAGFALSFGDAVGTGQPLQGVTAGFWTVPMKVDGVTAYRLKMSVRGNGVAIFGPNGEVFGWSDSRVSNFVGGLCFLEPAKQADGLRAMVARAWAASGSGSNPPSPLATSDDFAALGNYFFYGRVAGALNRMGETDIGFIGRTSSFPQVQFGPRNVITSLTSATSIGATTISTTDYIPPGTQMVTIDPGPNQEAVTTGAVIGDGPYSITVPALTNAHASGAIVQCAAPESMRYTVIYNQVVGALQFPIDKQPVSFGPLSFATTTLGTGLYLDSAFSSIINYSNGAVRLGLANAFATGRDTSANRPNAVTVGAGAQFYDTTLGRPIWSNGSIWKDAAGNTV
jgi:hypothetical protein